MTNDSRSRSPGHVGRMWRSVFGHLGAWSVATLTLPGLAAVQDRPAETPKPETRLRVQVTGAQPAVPVKGAAVYIEWKEGEETRTQEGTTNAEGIAGPYRMPRVTVFVQVTTSDDSWERYGGDHELREEQQTVSVNLKPTAPAYPDLEAEDIHEALDFAADAVRERELPLLRFTI